MSYIIAATDFSPISLDAVNYAADMAVAIGHDLVIIHSFSLPVMIGDVPIPASLIDDTQKDADEQMEKLVKTVSHARNGIHLRSFVFYGTILETIEKYTSPHGAPLVTIMGNTNTQEDTTWIFSTLSDATANFSLPVLAIPPGTVFKNTPAICLALDIEMKENAAALQKVSEMAVALKAPLHVVNVQKDTFNRDNFADVNEQTSNALLAAAPKYHFLYDEDVEKAIHKYCTDNNIDMLAVIHGDHSFFYKLIHRSHTKLLSKTMEIPILMLHAGLK